MKSLHEKRNKPTKGVNPFAKHQKKATKDWDGDGKVESPEAEWKGSKDKAIKGAKPKKKVGKMRVSCVECNSDIKQVKESRVEHRIKLRGFCENCNKAKVAYVDDLVILESLGNKFDRLIENNLPTGATLPPSSNPKLQAPANPTSTTSAPATSTTPSTAAPAPSTATPTPPAGGSAPVDPVAMAAKIVQQAAALLKDPTKLIDHMQKSAEELKKAQAQQKPATPPPAGQPQPTAQQPVASQQPPVK